jgi:hypothetical protein
LEYECFGVNAKVAERVAFSKYTPPTFWVLIKSTDDVNT